MSSIFVTKQAILLKVFLNTYIRNVHSIPSLFFSQSLTILGLKRKKTKKNVQKCSLNDCRLV